ncbi:MULTISPECIES: diacylglycerol/lipid kinase family protein [Flavobacterium]|jgi:diacylglycerol kinase (ATP)|uniref:Diacylglycerol kinase family lipid kinase n=1 Tax=Flavobacterium petrolei TaxID=2259594 RepID=A0A482TSC7_9FLAO|nr:MULTISPECIES: diacylglycerol kinase family protein [Flavobacterium]PIF63053.1 YegS/Rv2252/BmrU family lipid kinase [Flavobacterium sp. 11]RYJ50732.1 diacylglycerol kinase family lipid kinase [Flavobacterium petrolei]WKL45176.1 diacylglycerol kinase family lipid kinase [Flavobacterium sp. ZE23DGlu08]
MVYIHFIVNPISGSGKHNIGKTELEKHFPKETYKIAVDYSNYKKHAIILTQNAISNNPDCIVVCGGDGTINEVASCLINTKIKLGIIPVGSGNGLASNLNIPKSLDKATEIIRKGNTQFIDVGKVNDHYFFSNVGVGIDATIIKKYESYSKRTLFSYVRASIASSIQFNPMETILSFNNHIVNTNAFMIFISNSNEMGYGMSLTPKASLNDGLLDLVVISKLNLFDKLILGMRVISNKIEKFEKARHTLIEKINIEMPKKIFVDTQIDGEFHNLRTNKIEVTIIKSGLEVLTE